MNIGGFQKTSLIDYPDNISSIIWTVGCNFRCPYCYNKNVVLGTVESISEEEVFHHLRKRRGLIDGVVITGGEPLLHKDIRSFLQKIRKYGFLIKLDTNGTFPQKLDELFKNNLIDYVSMDIKAPKKKYATLAGVKPNIKDIEKSIALLQTQAPDYEFRTTVVPDLLTKQDLLEIAHWLKGSKAYYLQQFKPNTPLISSTIEQKHPYPKDYLLDVLHEITSFFDICKLRGVD